MLLIFRYARGGYVGAEMSLLASRVVRNLSKYHAKTCRKMGQEGKVMVYDWILMTSSTPPVLINYDLSPGKGLVVGGGWVAVV